MRQTLQLSSQQAYGAAILGGYALMLALNLPGHLSYDSLAQLFEGRARVRETFGPVVYAWILGRFDALSPGASLYLAASAGVAAISLAALPTLAGRTTWAAALTAAGYMLTPGWLVYQAVVWKDVLFANLAVAGFICLAQAARVWGAGGASTTLPLLGALTAFAIATQVRQNGALVAVFAVLVLAYLGARSGWRRGLAWGVTGLAALIAVSTMLALLAQPPGAPPNRSGQTGLRVLAHYDIVGTLKHAPTARLDSIRAANPETEAELRHRATALYTPERVDYLASDQTVHLSLWSLPEDVVFQQWRGLVRAHPRAYLKHRWDAFYWVFATPKIDSCLPLFVGVLGPERLTTALKLTPGIEPSDRAVWNYGTWFLDTPLFSHVLFALVAIVCIGILLMRRREADWIIIALLASALTFVGSFFIVSIACDYRYLYFIDLAAVTGALYVLLDPPQGVRRFSPFGRRRVK